MDNILQKVKELDVVTNRLVTNAFSGAYRSNFHGGGVEVEGLREYTAEDNARDIDWISTAKLGTPYIKKYQATRELPTFVIIDTSLSMRFGSTGTTKSHTALEAAAILLFSAVKNGETVGAILYDQEIQSYIPPRKGKSHALRILREIIFTYQNPTPPRVSNPVQALKEFNSLIKKHPICFLISDIDVVTDDLLKALSITNLKNDFIYVHIHDPFEDEIPDHQSNIVLADTKHMLGGEFLLSDSRLRKQYKHLRHQKNKERTTRLQQKGINNITLNTDGNTFVSFLQFFKHRKKQHAVRY